MSILCSYHYFRRVPIAAVKARFPEVRVNVFVDSGGFSAMSMGATVRLSDYSRYLHANEADIDVYANLDAIGDPEKTRRNQAVLEAEGLHPIPVFHVGSDFRYLDEILERYPYIALGGMVPHMKSPRSLGRWIHQCFDRIRQRASSAHGFGLGTSWNLIRSFPWRSVDSTAWTSVFQYRRAGVFDEGKGGFTSVDFKPESRDRFTHARLLRSYGFTPSDFGPDRFDYEKAGALAVMSVLRAQRFIGGSRTESAVGSDEPEGESSRT